VITTTAEFIETVRKAIHDDRARHAENLIDGGADDFAAYRESVGFIPLGRWLADRATAAGMVVTHACPVRGQSA
jgi:hypothetical protein